MRITDEEKQDFVARGKRIYEEKLKHLLEPEHIGEFAAIEPETGRYFLGPTVLAASDQARDAMPDNIFYLVRIGHAFVYKI